MDAQWADDLHHALHATLTGEKNGYYGDYGGIAQIARIYRDGVAYAGEYSRFRRRRHGRSYEGIDKKRLVVETQNHDQIGNRLRGRRLSMLVGPEKLRLAAACVLLSPFTPLLFMGEEFAAQNPFLYFASHENPELVEAVRKGRAEEWRKFGWAGSPPDPFAQETFERCVLRVRPENEMQAYYRRLIGLSKDVRKDALAAVENPDDSDLIVLRYRDSSGKETLVALCFGDKTGGWRPPESLRLSLQSGEKPLAPFSATVYGG
jgi:maltooligosyltrehalose trehalohydrolase